MTAETLISFDLADEISTVELASFVHNARKANARSLKDFFLEQTLRLPAEASKPVSSPNCNKKEGGNDEH